MAEKKNEWTVVNVLKTVLADEKEHGTHGEDFAKKVEAMLAQAQKKNSSASGKPSATVEKNAEVAAFVLESMDVDKEYLLDELIKDFIQPQYGEDIVSISKASAIMKKLVADGTVVKGKSKGKVTYKLA